jgi:hypothetical protein
MTNPLTLALGEDALTDLHNELDDLRGEVQAHRDGIGHLAEDPIHAGQPVHVGYRYTDGEPIYRLQVTHADAPLWQCERCRKLTLGPADGNLPNRCLGCDEGAEIDLSPLLYPTSVECREVASIGGGRYTDVPCLIAGSDGCECDEAR